MSGWTGKLLRVDLTRQRWKAEDIPQEWLRQYIGGRGIGDRYLWQELNPRVQPLSPDNKLIFASGPLSRPPLSRAPPYMVVTKGPLTHRLPPPDPGAPFRPQLK